jgi:hypothetical protein
MRSGRLDSVKDGGARFITARKRVYVYGRTREEAHERLVEEQAKVIRGIPVPANSWKLGPYLAYWLENVVEPARRPAPPATLRFILGHSHISTTQQIYTHVDEHARRDALTRLNKLLGGAE